MRHAHRPPRLVHRASRGSEAGERWRRPQWHSPGIALPFDGELVHVSYRDLSAFALTVLLLIALWVAPVATPR